MNAYQWLRAFLLLWFLCVASVSAEATARIEVRQADGASAFSAELGSIIDMEVAIDSDGEALTGYSLFLSYDASVFALVPAEEDAEGGVVPFHSGDLLGGIPLANSVEQIGDRIYLSYVEAAGSTSRQTAADRGVAARFQLEVVRRAPGGSSAIRIEERGHDFVSHYVEVGAPGVEQRFAQPLGEATVRITGFRISPMPDVRLIEGESSLVFDLDEYVDSLVTDVLWTHSRLSEIPTAIDGTTREVTMSPRAGFVGQRAMIFTAFEVGEGLTAADTVRIEVLARPHIVDFPDTIRFAEDSLFQELDFDAFAEDLDHAVGDLDWQAQGAQSIDIQINADGHIATFRPEADFFGSEQVSFIVTDPTGLADTVSVIVEVTPINDAPEGLPLTPIYPAIGAGPVSIPFERIVVDRDDPIEALQVFLEIEGPIGAEVADGQILVSGFQAARGILHITAQDTSGARATTRQVVVVLAEGESVGPELARLPEARFRGGQRSEIQLEEYVTDDGPFAELGWAATADSGLVVSISGGVLQIAGESGFAGSGSVLITVTDAQGNSDQRSLQAAVLRSEDDLGPRITAAAKVGLRDGAIADYALDEWVADPDHADETLAWEVFPTVGVDAVLDGSTRTLSVGTNASFVRPAEIRLRATDPQGLSDETAVPVLLARTGEAPQLAALPEVSLDSVGALVRVDLDDYVFDDVDRESELVWQIEAEPGVAVEFDRVTHDLAIRRDEGTNTPLSVTQVVVRVIDTSGLERTGLITVGLPPLFTLQSFPEVELFPGRTDSSIVLQDYAVGGAGGVPQLAWSVESTDNVRAEVDVQTGRLSLDLSNESFTGTDVLSVVATDVTGRQIASAIKVVVNGMGLSPQVRPLPRVEVEEGQVDTSIDLDDYVVDDDPDEALVWSVSGQRALAVAIDPITHVVTLDAANAGPSIERIQFVVRDRVGNTELATLEVIVLRGGEAPVIGSLPQVLLTAGNPEIQIDLSVFVTDEDTPVGELTWSVQTQAGITARLEGARLYMAIPAGQSGTRSLPITVSDPQGNMDEAELNILIEQDQRAPEFTLEIRRHPIFSDLVEIVASADEVLVGMPMIRVNGDTLEVTAHSDGSFRASYPHAPQDGELFAEAEVRGRDRGGNEGIRRQEIGLAWVDEGGGNVRSPDLGLVLNVPDTAARPGQMAIVYRVGPEETPPQSEDQPVYSIDLLGGRAWESPITLNFLSSNNSQTPQGILRWDEEQLQWQAVPTRVDEETGWLAASIDEPGLYRTGRVAAEDIRNSVDLAVFPNPFVSAVNEMVRIEYALQSPGMVRLSVYNTLGQRVHELVDEFQEVGVWTVGWSGRDAMGRPLGSGMYFIELIEGGQRHHRSMILLH